MRTSRDSVFSCAQETNPAHSSVNSLPGTLLYPGIQQSVKLCALIGVKEIKQCVAQCDLKVLKYKAIDFEISRRDVLFQTLF